MCPDIEVLAEKLIEHEAITEQEALQFRQHVSTCADCTRSFAEMQKLQSLIQQALKHNDTHPSVTDLHESLHTPAGRWLDRRITAHLRHCRDCRDTMQWLRGFDAMEKEFALNLPATVRLRLAWNRLRKRERKIRAGVSRQARERAIKQFGYAAAVLCGLALLGVSLHMNWPAASLLPTPLAVQGQRGEPPAKEIAPDHKSRQAAARLDAFKPWPELEELVGVHFRSDQLSIRQPRADTLRTATIVFEWQGADAPLIFKILDNRGTVVVREPAAAGRYICRNALSPGRYYWKLENSEELLWVGRFIVPQH